MKPKKEVNCKIQNLHILSDRVERKRKRQIRPIYLPGMQEQK